MPIVAPVISNSNPGTRLAYLDGWRGIAIILVLHAHFLANWSIGFRSGTLGVEIFFCLSGLLMANILFIQKMPLRKFYWRRFSRIYPAFLLYVAVIYGIGTAVGAQFPATEILATLTFVRTYWPIDPWIWKPAVPIGHLWSINVEEHSYLLLGILSLVAVPRRWLGHLLVMLGTTAIAINIMYIKIPQFEPPWGRIGSEVAASHLFISAGYLLMKDRLLPHIRSWMPMATLAATIAACSSWMPWWSEMILTPYLLAFTVNHLHAAPKVFINLLSSRIPRAAGLFSYSIYLWQQPLYLYKEQLPAGAGLTIALALGLLSYFLIEGPARRWLNNHTPSSRLAQNLA